METVYLTRVGRTIFASGHAGSTSDQVESWLEDKLTYYERKYNFSAVQSGGSNFTSVEQKLYTRHARTGLITFPLGLKFTIARGLKDLGCKVISRGGTLREMQGDAAEVDWDGLLQDFRIIPGQDECLANVVASDGGIIAATTGYGKGVIKQMICRMFPKAKIHVTTKRVTLAEQHYKNLLKTIPSVGFVGGGKRSFGRVTVFSADSLHHGMGDADILLADELHELVAPSYARVLGRYTRTRFYGFSATPTGRSDNRDIVAEALFGPVIYRMPYQQAESAGRVVPITVEWLKCTEGPPLQGVRNFTMRERVGVWRNDKRNELIAERVKKFGDDDQVLVMVKTIDHAVRLKKLLPEYTLVHAADGMDEQRLLKYIREGYLGDGDVAMSKERLGFLREEFAAGRLKKVIANYIWSTGVDFPLLSVLVRADAAASEIGDSQIPGRICRRVAGIKESALLIDVWDEWDSTFVKRSQSRRRNYTKRGWVSIWSDTPMSVL